MIEKVLKNLNIAALNHMQAASVEAAKKHKHIVLLSPTGSGKTLGFLLPILSRLKTQKEGVQAMILVPSRELGLQIEQVFKQMSTGFKVNCCYGGHPTKIERNNLLHPPALLIGTPGRIAYHIRHENFDPSGITSLVLDEFDKALEFGFLEDMSFIISSLPGVEHRTLTSATQMDEIPAFTGLKEPIEINYLSKSDAAPKGLELKQVNVKSAEKTEDLFNLVCKLGAVPTLIFCNHRDAVERISEFFHKHKMNHGIFHGKMEQEDRERSLIKFRNGSYRLLITTDLASRGLDIPEIQNVIHYQMPLTAETFTHRNGRTARMHATGTAYLVLSEEETLPEYISEAPPVETLEEMYPVPENTDWGTLYIAAGKKDKVNKVDIVGLLLQKGKLQKEELGRIEVLDFSAYAAVKRSKMGPLVKLLKEERIKNKKIKMEASY